MRFVRKFVFFYVYGTLLESQNDLVACMQVAFKAAEVAVPARSQLLSIVGLSLPQAMATLAPEQPATVHNTLVTSYKKAFRKRRMAGAAHPMPLFPGARDALAAIHARDPWVLGIATGKSRRGLDTLLHAHDLTALFVTQQVADDHPSKPHPSMIHTALSETGVASKDAVMVGDTIFDMQMAQNAGVPFIGVSWGYHAVQHLTGAETILFDFSELLPTLDRMWGKPNE